MNPLEKAKKAWSDYVSNPTSTAIKKYHQCLRLLDQRETIKLSKWHMFKE